jgi:uncharacterized protein YukE
MRKQMIENAAYEVATQVRAVEDSIDAVLADMAELQSKMIHARSVTGMAVSTSQEAFQQLAVALQALVGARGSVAGCHSALAEAKQFVPGLRTVAWGDGEECPPKTASGGLRVVA